MQVDDLYIRCTQAERDALRSKQQAQTIAGEAETKIRELSAKWFEEVDATLKQYDHKLETAQVCLGHKYIASSLMLLFVCACTLLL